MDNSSTTFDQIISIQYIAFFTFIALAIIFYLMIDNVTNNVEQIRIYKSMFAIFFILAFLIIFYKYAKQLPFFNLFSFQNVNLPMQFGFDKLYNNLNLDDTNKLGYYVIIGIAIAISMLLAFFYFKELIKGKYRNYGFLLFDVILFFAFIWGMYKLHDQFFSKQTIPTTQSFNDIFLYNYLFPIGFFLIYILYYFLVYRKDGVAYTDYSNKKVIMYNIFTAIIILYLLYQSISKFATTDNAGVKFAGHVFNTIPCILWAFVDYVSKDSYYALASILSSMMFIYFILSSLGVAYFNYNNWQVILTYIFLIVTGLTLMYKIVFVNTGLSENKYFNLLSKTILIIPCLVLVGLSKMNLGTPSEYLLLVLMSIGIVVYEFLVSTIFPMLFKKYLVKDGVQLVNKPEPISKHLTIPNDIVTETGSYDYKYGASLWIYVDSFQKTTNKLYEVCCLGDGLKISYNPLKNILYFSYNGVKNDANKYTNITEKDVKKWNKHKKNKKNKNNINQDKNEISDVIICKYPDVLLQKWNNIIINYSSGTLDIFMNGLLIKSSINVAPYINNTAVTIGMENGINGHISNLVYYPSPLNSNSINILYASLKSKNPPILEDDKLDYYQLAEILKTNFTTVLMPKNEK